MSVYLKYAKNGAILAIKRKEKSRLFRILVISGIVLFIALVGSFGNKDMEDCIATGICWGL